MVHTLCQRPNRTHERQAIESGLLESKRATVGYVRTRRQSDDRR